MSRRSPARRRDARDAAWCRTARRRTREQGRAPRRTRSRRPARDRLRRGRGGLGAAQLAATDRGPAPGSAARRASAASTESDRCPSVKCMTAQALRGGRGGAVPSFSAAAYGGPRPRARNGTFSTSASATHREQVRRECFAQCRGGQRGDRVGKSGQQRRERVGGSNTASLSSQQVLLVRARQALSTPQPLRVSAEARSCRAPVQQVRVALAAAGSNRSRTRRRARTSRTRASTTAPGPRRGAKDECRAAPRHWY